MKRKKIDYAIHNRSRTLPPSHAAAAFAGLQKLMRERFEENQSAAARTLGFAQQVINRSLRERKIGPGLANAVARELSTTLDRLVAASVDKWPNRTLAVELAREDGATDERIAEVLALPYDGSPDVSRVEWVRRMKAET